MKNGSWGTKILLGLVCTGALIYFGIQGYLYLSDPLTTTACYTYQVEETLSLTGYVVREERVLTDSVSGLLRLSRAEGERVSSGGVIAVTYADQASLERQEEIDALQTRIEQLEYAEQSALSSEVSLKLDNQILSTIYALRQDLAADRLDEAEDHVSTLRGLVLKRDYTYTDTGELDEQLKTLRGQLKTLQAQAGAGTRSIRAPQSGIYSAVVDGYEAVLTPESLEGLVPSTLSGLQAETVSGGELGKLVLGDSWYYAGTLSESEAEELTVGAVLTLRFAKGEAQGYPVRVASLSEPENGRVAAVFSCSSYLQEVTLLRRQSAELVLSSTTGLRVPKAALRVNEEGQTGLYCVSGRVARFKPVNVLYTGDEFALVSSATETERLRLRPGDEVIITANDLYDGKVVT